MFRAPTAHQTLVFGDTKAPADPERELRGGEGAGPAARGADGGLPGQGRRAPEGPPGASINFQ